MSTASLFPKVPLPEIDLAVRWDSTLDPSSLIEDRLLNHEDRNPCPFAYNATMQ